MRDEGGIDIYESVKVTWNRGKPPVLYVYDGYANGALVAKQEFKLANFNTAEKLHALMKKVGFQTKGR